MYNPYYHQPTEPTSYAPQADPGKYTNNQYTAAPHTYPCTQELPPTGLDVPSPFNNANYNQFFDYGCSPSPTTDHSLSPLWSSPHTSLTPMLSASLSTSSMPSPGFSPGTSPVPYVSPSPSVYNISPAFQTHLLSPYSPQTVPYPNTSQPHISSPSSHSNNISGANSVYPSLTRVRVPQRIEADTNNSFRIDFNVNGIPGISLQDAIKDVNGLVLDGACDKVFTSTGSRQIRLILTWPGYGQEGMYIPVQDRDGFITRARFAHLWTQNMRIGL
ncbi:unnamed protein product [Somion occarium]|uniref:Uncharacterized protein n=1 Tax=Somion occarium TaxID=3059160 RepID=A0ABP1D910_9APHY